MGLRYRSSDLYFFFRFPFRTFNPAKLNIDTGVWDAGETATGWSCMNRGTLMQDLTMLFFTAFFFVVAFLYVKACQKLR